MERVNPSKPRHDLVPTGAHLVHHPSLGFGELRMASHASVREPFQASLHRAKDAPETPPERRGTGLTSRLVSGRPRTALADAPPAVQHFHVVGPFEGGRIGHVSLAHRALDLRY